MIRSLLIASALLVSGSYAASAQASRPAAAAATPRVVRPPVAVKAAFAARFPTATGLKWEKEGADWEANFKVGTVETSAVFAKAGEFKEVEHTVAPTKLPAAVLPYLQKRYPGQKIKEAARIEDAAGTVTWEAEVGKKDVIFDADGTFLRVGGKAQDKASEDKD